MIRSSWLGWNPLVFEHPHDEGERHMGGYWNKIVKLGVKVEVTLTFIEFYDLFKLEDWRYLLYPKIPVFVCQWLPGSVPTLSTLQCLRWAYSDTLVKLEVYAELIDDRMRNSVSSLVSDLLPILRHCQNLIKFAFDSTITKTFVIAVARIRKTRWQRLTLFDDRIIDTVCKDLQNSFTQEISALEASVALVLGRKWKLCGMKEREIGPRAFIW